MSQLEHIYRKARAALEEKRYRAARDLGHQLLKMRFSGAFEVLAQSLQGEGQPEIALRVLENGVSEAPQVWTLWQQLGNCRSELGDLTGALEAYVRARRCPGSEAEQIDFNEAIMRLRFGNKERALEMLEVVIKTTKDKKLRLVALIHRLSTLIELGRVTEALMELGEARLHDADNAELLTSLSIKLLEVDDKSNALNLAKQALGLRRAGQAARVARLVEGELSDEARLFQLELKGKIEDESGKWHHFRKRSKVFADSEDEAVQFAIKFEPKDVRRDLQIEQTNLLKPASTEPKGVDWSSDLEFEN